MGNETANGTVINGWTRNTSPAQLFTYSPKSRTLNSLTSGKTVDIAGGTKVLLWECLFGENQQWIYDSVTRKIINPPTGKALILDDSQDFGGKDYGGNAIAVSADRGQEWSIRIVDEGEILLCMCFSLFHFLDFNQSMYIYENVNEKNIVIFNFAFVFFRCMCLNQPSQGKA